MTLYLVFRIDGAEGCVFLEDVACTANSVSLEEFWGGALAFSDPRSRGDLAPRGGAADL